MFIAFFCCFLKVLFIFHICTPVFKTVSTRAYSPLASLTLILSSENVLNFLLRLNTLLFPFLTFTLHVFSIPRYSQYTITLAYHVIAAWFIRSRVAYRKAFVGFVSKVSEVIFCNTWKLRFLEISLKVLWAYFKILVG